MNILCNILRISPTFFNSALAQTGGGMWHLSKYLTSHLADLLPLKIFLQGRREEEGKGGRVNIRHLGDGDWLVQGTVPQNIFSLKIGRIGCIDL